MKKSKVKILWPNNIEIYASDGEDWFSVADKVGVEIPTGCLTGSCGACEIDVNGKTVRACVSDIKVNQEDCLRVSFITDPFWES